LNGIIIILDSNAETPGGIPENLYFILEQSGLLYCMNVDNKAHFNTFNLGTVDYKCPVNMQLLGYAEETYASKLYVCTPEFALYAEKVMEDYRFTLPQTIPEAIQLFFLLIMDIENL